MKIEVDSEDPERDRTILVLIDGKEIFSTNYDEVGWTGMEKIEKCVNAINEHLPLFYDDRDHSKCNFSTGICGSTTAGTGKLDEFGYWEFPCKICALKLDLKCMEEKLDKYKRIQEAGMPISTAPRDGHLLRLFVRFTENSTEDAEEAWTIGSNNFDGNGEDEWQFAGWCWCHDHFTEGKGTPIGWLPLLSTGN